MADGTLEERLFALERDLSRVDEKLDRLLGELERAQLERARLIREMHAREARETLLLAALDLSPDAEIGDRGILEEMDDSILRAEDYILAMGERVQRVLTMLQEHKDVLDQVGEKVVTKGERVRTRLELDIAMNSISILALTGVQIDPSIPAEMEKLRTELAEGENLSQIRTRKEELVKQLEGEIQKYDLDRLFARKADLPGYR